MKNIIISILFFFPLLATAQEKVKLSNERPDEFITLAETNTDTANVFIITSEGLFEGKELTKNYKVIYHKDGTLEGETFKGVSYFVGGKSVIPIAVFKKESSIIFWQDLNLSTSPFNFKN